MKNYYEDYNYMERVENERVKRMARVKQVRIQKLILAVAIFITILICTIFSLKAFVYASDKTTDKGTKMYKSVVIYCGDTVTSIAEEYFPTSSYESADKLIGEIKSINHISEDTSLIPGNYLVVPYYN